MPWVLVFPLAVLLGPEDSLHLRVAGRPIHLLFCRALLPESECLFARHIAVGGNPLQGDYMASAKGGKSSRQVVVASFPI